MTHKNSTTDLQNSFSNNAIVDEKCSQPNHKSRKTVIM